MNQSDLPFDRDESARRREDAIRRVESNADDQWKLDAFQAVASIARTQEHLTTDDVWAVGGDVLNTQTGQIWRKTPEEDWQLLLGDIPGLMFKVHDGWFVGDGLAYRWNGSALEEHHPLPVGGAARPPKLLTVRSFGQQAFAVGGTNRATLLAYELGTWTPIEVPQECSGGQGLNGVFGTDPATLYVAGHHGAASRYDGAWTCDVPRLTDDHFHIAWEHDGEVLYGGGDLFEFGDNHGTVAIHPDRGSLPVVACE